jgi:hypothetical protein
VRFIRKKSIIIIVALLLAGAGGAYALHDLVSSKQDTVSPRPRNTVNYAGPTDAEAAAGDEQKKQIVNEQSSSSTPQTTANLQITDASQYDDIVEVRGFVSNIVETGGTCTYVFTQGGATVTETTPAQADATTTQCKTLDTPRAKFVNAGVWQLIATYESASAKGTAKATVTIR